MDVVSIFSAARADLVQAPHRFQVSRAVFQDAKEAGLTVTQFLRALRNLFLESVLGLAEFLFQRFLRGQVSDDYADCVGLRLKLGKRKEHRNLPAAAETERVLPANALLSRLFQIVQK